MVRDHEAAGANPVTPTHAGVAQPGEQYAVRHPSSARGPTMKGYRLFIEGCWFDSSRLHVLRGRSEAFEPRRLHDSRAHLAPFRTHRARRDARFLSSALSSAAECPADNRNVRGAIPRGRTVLRVCPSLAQQQSIWLITGRREVRLLQDGL